MSIFLQYAAVTYIIYGYMPRMQYLQTRMYNHIGNSNFVHVEIINGVREKLERRRT